MTLIMLVDEIISDFKESPRNKVFVPIAVLCESASEELGKKVSVDKLTKVISDYIAGNLSEKNEAYYDGAVAVCGEVARRCFGDGPDDDVDYEISWIENDDDTFSAEIRPS
jgi:hypothetical protein